MLERQTGELCRFVFSVERDVGQERDVDGVIVDLLVIVGGQGYIERTPIELQGVRGVRLITGLQPQALVTAAKRAFNVGAAIKMPLQQVDRLLALAVEIEPDCCIDDLGLSRFVLTGRKLLLDLRLGHGEGTRAQRRRGRRRLGLRGQHPD